MNKYPEQKHDAQHAHTAPRERRDASLRKLKAFTAALSVCVAAGTVGALMLPAVTLTQPPECEIAEHTHGESCYETVTKRVLQCGGESLQVHTHAPECYDAESRAVCGYGDAIIHLHDALCCGSESGALICTLPELASHIHSEACCTVPQTVLDEGHTHGDACYNMLPGTELICGLEETAGHTHGESCFISAAPVCGLEESEAHAHEPACYITVMPGCGIAESAGHTHGESCCGLVRGELICTETEREPVIEYGVPVLSCSLPEIVPHTHTEECLVEGVLACGMTEWKAHQHTEACFADVEEQELICELEEHTHSSACTSYPEADLETADVWEATLPAQLTGEYAVDVLRIARSQLGYRESVNNYMLSDYGARMGYTRYGAWYGGDPYGDWCAMFISFCIRYAGLSDFPLEAGCDKWIAALNMLSEQSAAAHEADPENAFSYYMPAASGYQPVPGDFVFFDMDADGCSDHVALIEQFVPATEAEPATLLTIEGNSADMVQYAAYTAANPAITGYGRLPAQDFACGSTGHIHDAYCGGCALTEHVHTADCLPGAEDAESEDSERKFETVSWPYTTTVIAPAGAELPEDTVINAEPLFDSDEPSAASFSLDPETDSGNESDAWVEAIRAAITWGDVTRIKLFDISLSTAEGEVQPNVPVQVRTEFAQPLYIGEGEVVYGVHFGANGVEILPAETERNEYGEINAITHTQSSFSTTGYVLVHIPNPEDVAPDVLPVHYCIWVNGQWIIVGSSRTGWYGGYDPREEWPPPEDQRDYITVDQMYSVLKDYGLSLHFDSGNLALTAANIQNMSKSIWYQRAEYDTDTGTTIRHDTTPVQKEVQLSNGDTQTKWVFPLSGNRNRDDGYHIYFVPSGTLSGKESDPSTTYDNNAELGADLAQLSKYYSFEVRDMNGVVYDGSTKERMPDKIPAIQYVRHSSYAVVDVLTNGELGWQLVDEQGKVTRAEPYEENPDGTATYLCTNMQGRMTLIPYSDAVDGARSDKSKTIDLMVHLDGEWQNIGHISLLYQKDGICNDKWFVTAGQLYTYMKDFGFTINGYKPDDVSDTQHKFAYAYGRASELENGDMIMHVCDDNEVVGNNNNNNNNTIAIGLGTEEDTEPRHYTVFYIPGSDDESFGEVEGQGALAYAASDKIIGDRFYSVKIVDDYMLVYYSYETDNFLVYVPEGQGVSVSVQNAPDVLWSVREPWATDRQDQYVASKHTVSYDNNFNTYEFEAVNGPQVIEASSLNPNYSVQYFATIKRYQLYNDSGTNRIPIIDTRFGLPANGTTPALKYLGLTGTSANYTVDTYDDIAEIYTQTEYTYEKAHFWDNIDKLYSNDHYTIQEIRILKEGRDPLSTVDDDFWIYKVNNAHDNIEFTNHASDEYAPRDESNNVQQGEDYTILITEGMVLRLFYTLSESYTTNSNVAFYDYDVSSDGSSRVRKGINSIHGSHTGTGYAGYAFGNDNTKTGTGDYRWNGNALNIYNGPNYGNGYLGCTFGLVNSFNADGTLNFAGGITAPVIFAGTKPNGRSDYTGSLTFHRQGDVYTLSASSVGSGANTNLEHFFNPGGYATIYTNNFWALDGLPGVDKLGGGANPPSSWLPESDDGQNHNSYFGMNFAIEFSLTSDYIGPTEYIFFGDDDMWVFLSSDTDSNGAYDTQQLICDIGGVHSSVGEYVDLRNYIPEGSAGRYRLDFYYVERGASGSTCWMSFTLPSATFTTVEAGTSEIVITKKLIGVDNNPVDSDERYEFTLELFTDSTKTTPIVAYFSGQIERANGDNEYRSFTSGHTIRLAANDRARVKGLPIGTYYVVTETADDRFNVEANGKEGWVVEGSTAESIMAADYVNIQKGYLLPNTGGSGSPQYILGGIALMGTVLLIYKKRRPHVKGG